MFRIRGNSFAKIVSIIALLIFLLNLILSRDYNIVMIMLTGGGKLIDSLGVSYDSLFKESQLYRSITYGYLHPAIWHLAVNVLALWYTGLYLEKVLNKVVIFLIYHAGLIIPCAVFVLLLSSDYMYGASPAIFCCLGMMTMWLIIDHSMLDEYKRIRGNRYLLAYMIISNFLGLGTFVIHLAGFCTGLLLGLFIRKNRGSHRP